jgi:hypothetical protein
MYAAAPRPPLREGVGDDRGLGKVENSIASPVGLLLITISNYSAAN